MQRRDALLIHRARVSPGIQQGASHIGIVWTEQRSITGFEAGILLRASCIFGADGAEICFLTIPSINEAPVVR